MTEHSPLERRFLKSLYEPPAVHAAAAAYEALARVHIVEEKDAVLVRLEPSGDGGAVADLFDHFANHVLCDSIRRWREAQAGPDLAAGAP